MHRQLALALALAACNGATVDEDTGATDTGLADTGLTDTGEDTSPPPCDRFEITGSLGVSTGAILPAGEVSVDLLAVDISGDDLTEIGARAEASAGALADGADAPFSLCIDAVPSSDDLYAPDSDNPSFMAATYVLRAYEGDGSGGAAQWVGASLPTLLVYAEGTPPTTWSDVGVATGWNLLTLDFVDGSGTTATAFASGDAFDLEANLLELPQPALAGTVVPDISSASSPAAAAYNITSLVDTSVPPPVTATVGGTAISASTANASISLGPLPAPPDDHTYALASLPFVEAGLFMALAWDDTNGSLAYEVPEPGLASSTDSASPRVLVYARPTDWRAVFYTVQGMRMGWNLSENDTWLPWSTGVILDAGT